ncbi:MAG: epimerase, partial [Bacillota bacterium]
PGRGYYRLQPIFVEDLADIAINAARSSDSMIIEAAGPRVFTFEEMVLHVARKVHSRAKIIHISPKLALFASQIISRLIGDVVLTRDEVKGLMADLLVSNGPPGGKVDLEDWLEKNAGRVGMIYASELARHYK